MSEPVTRTAMGGAELGAVAVLCSGQLLAGKLRVIRLLGSGGMGVVYEVEHELTRHRRAVKLLHTAMARNAGAVARFLREASAAGRIGSEHVVQTFDAGVLESGEPYLVMELLEGQSLAEILRRRGPLTEQIARDWIAQACDGAQAAHDAGIVHRDIKPDNLFIERSGRVKLMDFGISKFEPALTGEPELTRGDLALGTPYYMAPEQMANRVDVRTDVYALGVVLYETITGKKPFTAESYPELVLEIHAGAYPPASSVAPSSTLLDRIVARAMARDPEARFASASEFGRALRALDQQTERVPELFAEPRVPLECGFPATLLGQVDTVTVTPRAPAMPATLPYESTLPSPRVESIESPSRSASRSRGSRWFVLALLVSGASIAWVWRSRRPYAPVTAPESAALIVPNTTREPRSPVPLSESSRSVVTEPAPSASSLRTSSSSSPKAFGAVRVKSTSRATQHRLEQTNPFE